KFTLEKLVDKNISHQAIFYRKELFDKLGTFEIRYKLHADWHFNIRCFENRISHHYLNRRICYFNCGGTSAGHDKLFLREFLIPVKLKQVAENPPMVKSLKQFDIVWRLLRNAEVKGLHELPSGTNISKQRLFKRMLEFQNRFSIG